MKQLSKRYIATVLRRYLIVNVSFYSRLPGHPMGDHHTGDLLVSILMDPHSIINIPLSRTLITLEEEATHPTNSNNGTRHRHKRLPAPMALQALKALQDLTAHKAL